MIIAFMGGAPQETMKSSRAARAGEIGGPQNCRVEDRACSSKDFRRPPGLIGLIGPIVVARPFTQCIHRPIVKQINDRYANARAAVAVGLEARCMPVDLRVAAEDFRRGRLDQAARVCEAALAERPRQRRGTPSPRAGRTPAGRPQRGRPHDRQRGRSPAGCSVVPLLTSAARIAPWVRSTGQSPHADERSSFCRIILTLTTTWP